MLESAAELNSLSNDGIFKGIITQKTVRVRVKAYG
jgi:hypothetical protein